MSRKTQVGVIRFPGTNCDQDVFSWVQREGLNAKWIWHRDSFSDQEFDLVILPGGFSYGDYLRSGALAAQSKAVESLISHVKKGRHVLGICNGFQILCEAKLLPGALVTNQSLRFQDDWVDVRVENTGPVCAKVEKSQKYKLPIAHKMGRFFAPADDLKKIQDSDQVWLRYEKNPNGSLDNIAGIWNAEKTVCALMPHPERASLEWMGSQDGKAFL